MICIIRDVKNNLFLNVYKDIFHWDSETKSKFKNKWEANKIMKTLANKRNFQNFRIEAAHD